jgi:hypothetical protein
MSIVVKDVDKILNVNNLTVLESGTLNLIAEILSAWMAQL